MADKRVLVMNGPNLNLLGMREPGVYGDESYDAICARVEEQARALGLQADFFQSNSEGALIDRLHAAMGVYDGIVLNAGAYTHYSYAIRDAIAAIAPVCRGQIAGFGPASYTLALHALRELL